MPENKQEKITNEVYTDFDGTGNQPKNEYKGSIVPDNAYEHATIINTSVQINKYAKQGQNPKQLVIQIRVNNKGTEVELPYFVNPRITKAYTNKEGKTMDASKLYLLLEMAGLLDKARAEKDVWKSIDSAAQWLNNNLAGKECRVFTKTNAKNTDKAYSKIDRIAEFE